jgi:hypothetical protein
MKTDYEEFPEYAEGEMNHWDGCNQLRPEDYYDNQTD